MPTKRSRHVDETHPIARYFFQASDLANGARLLLDYPDPDTARRAATMLRNFRERAALAPPATHEPSAADPLGEGRGHFDHIEISQRANSVILGHRRQVFPAPQATRVEESADPTPHALVLDHNFWSVE